MTKLKFKFRYIENGPVVVCIATARFNDQVTRMNPVLVVKAKARVNESEGDVYDVQKGRDLSRMRAITKAYKKVIRRETNRLKYFEDIKTTLENQLESFKNLGIEAENNLVEFKNTL